MNKIRKPKNHSGLKVPNSINKNMKGILPKNIMNYVRISTKIQVTSPKSNLKSSPKRDVGIKEEDIEYDQIVVVEAEVE